MTRPLRAADRYARGASPTLIERITEWLPYTSFYEAHRFYTEAAPSLKPNDLALLGLNDRYFLLVGLCNRVDAIHPWIYERAREVEADPDGHIDLWSRYHYKAVMLDELVPTPDGWVRHGDLKPGDQVYGPDGNPCRVVARTPVFTDADCYGVTFCDGYSVVVSGDHLWTVNLPDKSRINGSNKRKKWKSVTIATRELKNQVDRAQASESRRYPAIPVAAPIVNEEVYLPLDPYVLGVWLGDGTVGHPYVTAGLDDADEMAALLAATGVAVRQRHHSNAVTLALGNGVAHHRTSSDVANALRELGVYNHKRIPPIYLAASVDQRWSLLQGLMDTDGSCHKEHSQAIFCCANEDLASDAFALAQSLGLKATIAKRHGQYNESPRPFWQVQFLGRKDRPPFRMRRKIANCRGGGFRGAGALPYRRIVSVEPTPTVPVSCIQVDRPDGLYLIGRHYVTTHNSSVITFAGVLQEILIDPEIRVCIFSNTDAIARPFLRQIMEELESNEELKCTYSDVLWEHPKRQAPIWSLENGIILRRQGNPRECTVEAHGLINALPTGKHFPLMVYDDIINERNVTSPDQIKKATERTELSFPCGIGEKTRKWFVGTRYHFGDSYGHLIEHKIATPRIYPATDDGKLDGDPVFMTPEAWAVAKREMRSVIAAQMLQSPLAGLENVFRIKWLKPYWVVPIMMNVAILGDPSRGRGKTSDRTALAVVGIDAQENKYLLDAYCHRMPLSERWEKLSGLQKKWSNTPGVQSVKVLYERYGMQSDLEYFEEKMRTSGQYFEIKEVGWTGERGGESKKARVERLEPDFRLGSFFVPGKVWNRDFERSVARWEVSDDTEEIVYSPYRPHQFERRAKANGELWRLFEPLRRLDEDGAIYDATRVFFEEFIFFPFSPRDDLIDAVSRIYDADMVPPVKFERVTVEDFPDS